LAGQLENHHQPSENPHPELSVWRCRTRSRRVVAKMEVMLQSPVSLESQAQWKTANHLESIRRSFT
jgi:hypothetical protein